MSDSNRLISSLAAETYHAERKLSSSALKHLERSPAHLLAYWENPPEQTAEMRFGSAVHALKHKDQEVLRCDVSSRNTKAYKELAEANPKAIVLLSDEYESALRMIEKLDTHPVVRELYTGGEAEVSAYWRCTETGILCKARADYFRGDGMIVDLKTAKDASPDVFQRDLFARRYHWQSAHYLDGFGTILGRELTQFVHVVIEKEPPYEIGVYVLDDASLEKAREDVLKLRRRYAAALHSGEFSGYSRSIQNVGLPAYGFSLEVEHE
jgi:hypothetical protein